MDKIHKGLIIIILSLIILLSFSSVLIYYFFQTSANTDVYHETHSTTSTEFTRFPTTIVSGNLQTETSGNSQNKVDAIRKIMKRVDEPSQSIGLSFGPIQMFIGKVSNFYVDKISSLQIIGSESVHKINEIASNIEQSIYQFMQILFDVYILPVIYIIATPLSKMVQHP
jgi:hypothetical protein